VVNYIFKMERRVWHFKSWHTFLLCALNVYASFAQGDPMEIARRAYELQQAGDYAAAAEAYRSFLKLRPDEIAAHSNLGVVLGKLGRYDEAITEYESARKLAPNDSRIAVNLALAYYKSGRISAAETELVKLHATAQQDQQVTMLLADCELRLGENAKVIDLLKPVEAQNQQDLGIAYLLGTALIREKRIEEGQVLVDRILKNGDTAESRFLLGSQVFAAANYPEAVKQLASAIELNPDVPELQSLYGRALLLTGDADGAAAAFKRELANGPNNFEANLFLGQILDQRRQHTEAAPYLARAALLRPASTEALLSLAKNQLSLDKVAEARKTLEMASQTAPGSASVHAQLAEVYRKLNLHAEAAREKAAAARLKGAEPSDAWPHVNETAPDFTLSQLHSPNSIRLQNFRGKSPVVLVFGSYTCPNFRAAARDLDRLYAAYGQQAPFLLVYIREAHTSDNWQSTRNEREHVDLSAVRTMGDKEQHATMCVRKLQMGFPALIDGMDGKVESAYSAWPSRAFVIGKDGRILYSTRLTELDFQPSEMEMAIKQAIAGEKRAAR
jgi:Flp pilus assembly protein TadD/peroxiredoxin